MDRNEQLAALKTLLSVEGVEHDVVFNALLELAERVMLSNVFPFKSPNDVEKDKAIERYDFWVVLCAKEIYDKKDMGSGLQQYSENGINFTLAEASGLMSYGLLGQLVPKAMAPQ